MFGCSAKQTSARWTNLIKLDPPVGKWKIKLGDLRTKEWQTKWSPTMDRHFGPEKFRSKRKSYDVHVKNLQHLQSSLETAVRRQIKQQLPAIMRPAWVHSVEHSTVSIRRSPRICHGVTSATGASAGICKQPALCGETICDTNCNIQRVRERESYKVKHKNWNNQHRNWNFLLL